MKMGEYVSESAKYSQFSSTSQVRPTGTQISHLASHELVRHYFT